MLSGAENVQTEEKRKAPCPAKDSKFFLPRKQIQLWLFSPKEDICCILRYIPTKASGQLAYESAELSGYKQNVTIETS